MKPREQQTVKPRTAEQRTVKLSLLALLLASLLLLLSTFTAASHVSFPPSLSSYQQYYGKVIGLPAGTTGLLLKAVLEDGHDFSTPVAADGKYGYSPTFKIDDPDTGQKITFYLVKQLAMTKVGEATFDPSVPVVEMNFQAPPTFTGPLDFSLTNGGNRGVAQGSSITTNVTATLVSGIPEAVSLTISGVPAGVTAAFSAASCTPTCRADLTISSSSSAAVGTAPITITATGGGKTKTTSFTLTVTPPAPLGFTLSNEGNKKVLAGKDVKATIRLDYVSGTSQPVAFTTPGLSAGMTSTFSPTSCAPPCSTELELDTSSSLSTGSYPITVEGSGGGLTLQTNFTLNVTPFQPLGFTLSAAGNKSVAAGATATNEITATYTNGTPQFVSFVASGLPSGVTSSFSRSSCVPDCTTILTVVAATSAPVGSYLVSVAGVVGNLTVKTGFNLTLTAAPASICTNNWQCGDWSVCVNNLQTRNCHDVNKCDQSGKQIITLPKPEEQRICQAPPPGVTPPVPSPQICSSLAKQCLGNQLQQCSYDGKTWSTLESCAYGCDTLTLTCQPVPPTIQKPFFTFKPWMFYLAGSLVLLAVIVLVATSLFSKRKYAPAREYISEGRAHGLSREQLRQRLVSQGWDPQKIKKLLK